MPVPHVRRALHSPNRSSHADPLDQKLRHSICEKICDRALTSVEIMGGCAFAACGLYLKPARNEEMMLALPMRDDAWTLLCEYTQNENLRKHALAVEACVRAYARKTGADEELWGLTALLHDFDYERWPNDAHSSTEEHPAGGSAILRERGYPEEMIRAILSHADS